MKFIKSNAELEHLHSVGEGLIYNDFSGRGPRGKDYNILHAASCGWVLKSNVNIPKYFFGNINEAIEWLRKNRGNEGENWKRCGTCKAKARPPLRDTVSFDSVSSGATKSTPIPASIRVPLIDSSKFKNRFKHFRKIDYESYPYCFGEFWRWKLRVETEESHILDAQHIKETYRRLGQTLKIWQWHRPDRFSKLGGRLKKALDEMCDAYNQIRSFSLLEFSEIPSEPMELVYDELGCVKTSGSKRTSGYYLVMATTKPLMFLWGQTLAFDTIVRRFMPRFGMSGLSGDYWSFETWREVMEKTEENLKQQAGIIDLFDETSLKEYGASSIVPYGQFLDLYYWTRG